MLLKPDTCAPCPLFTSGTGFLRQDIAEPRNGVMLVGEAPGADEIVNGECFVGQAGATLEKCIIRGGMHREDFSIYNVLSCRPPDNKLKDAPYEAVATACCNQYFDRAIRRAHPRVIVALGAVAAKALVPDMEALGTTILDMCGYVFWNPRYECWVIPAPHPSFVLRGKTAWAQVIIFCLQKAVQIAQEGYAYATVDYTLDPTPEEAMRWVDDFERYYEAHPDLYLSTDIETPDKQADEEGLELDALEDAEQLEELQNRLSHTIVRCGYAYRDHHALSIPWDGSFRAVHERLLTHRCQKLFWNASFDCPRIRSNDLMIAGVIHDAMEAWHVLNSDLKKKLGFVTPFFCFDQGMWKHLSNEKPAYYNAVDCDAALRNMLGTVVLLKKVGLWNIYQEFILEMDPVFSAMSAAGMPVSRDARIASSKTLTAMFDANRAAIDGIVPLEVHPFHPKTGYIREPEVTEGLRLVAFEGLQTKRCPGCQKKNPPKSHFKTLKTKENPCAGLAPILCVEGEQRWVRVDPFVPSTAGILRYQQFHDHAHVFVGRGAERRATTDKKAIKKLIGRYPEDPLYPRVRDDRDIGKIGGTYVGWWDADVNKVVGGFPVGRDHRVHGTFRNTPSTLRTSMVSPNLQNLPRGSKRAGDIQNFVKGMFVAPDGSYFVARDFSGIEAQLVGVHANDPTFLRLSKVDIHSYFTAHNLHRLGILPAADVPQLSWSDDDLRRFGSEVIKARFKDERDIGKRCIHAGNYRVGPGKLQEEYPEWFHKVKDAAMVLGFFYEVFPAISKWHERICKLVDKEAVYKNSFGHMHRFYQVLNWEKNGSKWEWSYGDDAKRLIAFGPQSDAAFIGRLAGKRLYYNYPDTVRQWLRLFIHDEWLVECPTSKVDEADAVLQFEMEKPVKQIPLPASWGFGPHLIIESEGKRGQSWAGMK